MEEVMDDGQWFITMRVKVPVKLGLGLEIPRDLQKYFPEALHFLVYEEPNLIQKVPALSVRVSNADLRFNAERNENQISFWLKPEDEDGVFGIWQEAEPDDPDAVQISFCLRYSPSQDWYLTQVWAGSLDDRPDS